MSALIKVSILAILFTSCSPQRRLSNLLTHYPDLIQEIHDTLIVYRDTTVNISVVGTDTVYKYGTIRDTVYASSGTAHSVSYVTHDTLRLYVWQSDTTLKVRLDSAIRELQIKDREIIEVQQKCDKSKFEKILDKFLYIFLVIAFIVLIQFFIKIFK